MRKSVVLPAPLAPMMPTMPPGGRRNDRSSISSCSPNALPRCCASITRSPRRGPGGSTICAVSGAFSRLCGDEGLVGRDARLALGLAGARALADPFELALQAALARGLGLAFLLEPLLLLLEPAGVVAFVGNALAAIELENPAGDLVEEVAIVGHGDDGAGIVGEKALQPGDRFRVEMVGRLVEQQQVGFLQQQAAKRDAPPLAARERRDRGVARRAAQRVHRDLDGAVQFPARRRRRSSPAGRPARRSARPSRRRTRARRSARSPPRSARAGLSARRAPR